MKKEELINKLKDKAKWCYESIEMNKDDTEYKGKLASKIVVYNDVILDLKKLEEPQREKVVVPRIMEKHIVQSKSARLTIRDALNQALLDTEGEEELYSKAWLAYPDIQSDEDRVYRVKVGKVLYFVEFEDGRPVFVIDDAPGAIDQAYLFDYEKHAKQCAEQLGGTYEEVTF